jgi:exonuclease SbcD
MHHHPLIMKFSHMADCHVGSYRDERMKALSIQAFQTAIDESLQRSVDFILISGDLFNTSLPAIDALKAVTQKLKKVAEEKIPVYIIAGSHDFSPSGKTMLDVLEHAGLCINVVKGSVNEEGKLQLQFTEDEKTGVKITGMIGKRGTLEKVYYESLELEHLEQEPGFKIFMFHSAIDELKPKELESMESTPLSYLPKGFNYYAGGHVHTVMKTSSQELGGVITYPGPLFPNSFKELQELKQGGFYIFDTENPDLLEHIPVKIKDIVYLEIDAEHKSAETINAELEEAIKCDVRDTIVLLRLKGKLASGKASDIDLRHIFDVLYEEGAYFVMRNTSSLTSELFEEIALQTESIHDIEHTLINEHIGQMKFTHLPYDKETEKTKVTELMELLDVEKQEGETQKDFEERLKENIHLFDK